MPAPHLTTSILVADDDPQVLRLVTRNLQLEGYTVSEAHDGQQALEQLAASRPDLVLLDVLMPRLDGLAVIQAARTFSQVPIILLAARAVEQEKLQGFALGADDCLTKPFSVEELLARVRAVLRRTQTGGGAWWGQSQSAPPRATVGDLVIDRVQQQVTRRGLAIDLSATEYRLLATLAAHLGQLMAPEQLLEQVWGPEYRSDVHLLQAFIYRLRQKIEPEPEVPRYLLTRREFGYLLAASPAP